MSLKRKFNFDRSKAVSGTSSQYRKWSDWEVGQFVVAEYIHSQPNTKYPNQINHVCTILDAGNSELKEGRFTFNNATTLNKLVANDTLKKGDIFELVFNGYETIKNGPYKGKQALALTITLDTDEEEEGDANFDYSDL